MPEKGQDFIENDFGASIWLNFEFELIEEQTIDIDSIAGMVIKHYQTPLEKETYIQSKINELVQAVKHLNKEIQSIKEK